MTYVAYYQCDGCGRRAHTDSEIADMGLWRSGEGHICRTCQSILFISRMEAILDKHLGRLFNGKG